MRCTYIDKGKLFVRPYESTATALSLVKANEAWQYSVHDPTEFMKLFHIHTCTYMLRISE